VLVPGARPDSIGASVASRLRCAAVAPGANIPYGFGALEILHERSIVAVPDFVSNSGGVHLYETVAWNEEPEPALAAIAEIVRQAVLEVLAASDELDVTPVAAGFRAARAYLAETTGASADVLDDLFPA
jgi:glutamate dehydrogenase (NAD(P)+)